MEIRLSEQLNPKPPVDFQTEYCRFGLEIVSRSGQHYFYDRNTNRIGFHPIGKIDSSNIQFSNTKIETNITIFHFCIEITQECNFRCRYCCYSGDYSGWRQHSTQSQSKENLDLILSFIRRFSPQDSPFSIAFYGGEALLEFGKIRYLVDRLIHAYGDRVTFSVTTNGYLLTPAIVDIICSIPGFGINVTIDGDEAMHDSNRVLKDGHGTYRQIIQNLMDFEQRYPNEFNLRIGLLATLHSTCELTRLNDAWMSNDILKDYMPKHISMIVPNFNKLIKDTPFEEKLDIFYLALDHYKKGYNDVLTQQLIEITEPIRQREIFNLPENYEVSTCLSNIESCYIDCDGNIAPCEKVCDSFRIGDIETGINESKLESYNNKFISFQNKHCKKCWAQRLCNICPKHLEYSDTEMEYICLKEREFAKLSLIMFCELVEQEES